MKRKDTRHNGDSICNWTGSLSRKEGKYAVVKVKNVGQMETGGNTPILTQLRYLKRRYINKHENKPALFT